MATQYIEDPDTKERIPFEWNKTEPPTGKDIDSLFKTVKSQKVSTEAQGTITKAPPWWMRDIVKPTMEYGGMTAGAVAGTALATPVTGPFAPAAGGVPGAAVGYATGARAYRELENLAYGTKEPGTYESVGRTTEELGTGAAIEMTGQMLPVALSWLINKLPGVGTGIKPAFEKVNQIAKEEGIKLPLPAKTGSSTHAGVFKTASVMPTSEGTIAQEVSESMRQVEQMSNRTIKGKGLDVTPGRAGTAGKEGVVARFEEINAQSKLNWEAMAKEAEKDEVMVKPNEANVLRGKLENDPHWINMPSEFKQKVNNFFDKTTEVVPKMREDVRDITRRRAVPSGESVTSNKQIPFTVMDEWRKEFGSLASSEELRGSYQQKLFGDFKVAIEKDMESAAKTYNSKAYDLLKDARQFEVQNIYGEFKGKTENYKTSMGKKLFHSTPEEVLNHANTATGLKELESVMPQDHFNIVRKGKIAENIKFKTIPIQDGEVRIVDGEALRKTIYEGMTPEYRTKLFKPDELKALDRLIEITRAFNRIEKLGGSQSGTPKGMWYGRLMTGEVVSMGAGYGVGGIPGMAVGITLSTLGPYGIAKFITSDAGKKFLIEGVKLGKMTRLTGTALGYAGMALTGRNRSQAIESGQSQEAVE